MELLLLKKSCSRGQVFSADSLLGLVVFLFALSIVFLYFNQLFERNSSFEESSELEILSFNALRSLVETKGLPENWNSLQVSEINALGIASERNVLDPGRLSRFLEISGSDYNSVKGILGLRKFDFRFSVNDLNGALVFSAGSAESSRVSFKTSRLAIIDGRIVKVSLEAFK